MTERSEALTETLSRAQQFLRQPEQVGRAVFASPDSAASARAAYTGGVAHGLLAELVEAIRVERVTH